MEKDEQELHKPAEQADREGDERGSSGYNLISFNPFAGMVKSLWGSATPPPKDQRPHVAKKEPSNDELIAVDLESIPTAVVFGRAGRKRSASTAQREKELEQLKHELDLCSAKSCGDELRADALHSRSDSDEEADEAELSTRCILADVSPLAYDRLSLSDDGSAAPRVVDGDSQIVAPIIERTGRFGIRRIYHQVLHYFSTNVLMLTSSFAFMKLILTLQRRNLWQDRCSCITILRRCERKLLRAYCRPDAPKQYV